MKIFEKTINGSLWKTKELDGDSALTLALDILQLVAPTLAVAGKNYKKDKDFLDQEIKIENVVQELFKDFSTEKTQSIIKRLLAETWKLDNRDSGLVELRCADHFDKLFAGKKIFKDLIPVLKFVFQENFSSFSELASFTNQ